MADIVPLGITPHSHFQCPIVYNTNMMSFDVEETLMCVAAVYVQSNRKQDLYD